MKPVAYISSYDLARLPLYDCWVNGEKFKGSVPLYEHSAELTDMEIIEIANKFKNLELAVVAFARAILKKANET